MSVVICHNNSFMSLKVFIVFIYILIVWDTFIMFCWFVFFATFINNDMMFQNVDVIELSLLDSHYQKWEEVELFVSRFLWVKMSESPGHY